MKKIIHALTIVDKSTSMEPYKSRTIEGINGSLNELRKEVDKNTKIINTLLQFSSASNRWGSEKEKELDFVFSHIGKNVEDVVILTDKDYIPAGGTPLLDAIGYGIEKFKEHHGDDLGNDNLSIIVTIFTDGEENSSTKWNKAEIKKMFEHFQSDDKWTFTFVGCGSLDDVTQTSATLGVIASNTMAYASSDLKSGETFNKIGTSYTNYARSAKLGVKDVDLFTSKSVSPSPSLSVSLSVSGIAS